MKLTDAQKMMIDRNVQHDPSGVGHAWRKIAGEDIPANIAEEIAAEIIDGKREHGEYIATNGLHYCW